MSIPLLNNDYYSTPTQGGVFPAAAANFMAEQGRALSAQIEKRSQQDQARAISPKMTEMLSTGYQKLSQGDASGLEDVSRATSLSVGNPFLMAMSQDADKIGSHLLDGYIKSTKDDHALELQTMRDKSANDRLEQRLGMQEWLQGDRLNAADESHAESQDQAFYNQYQNEVKSINANNQKIKAQNESLQSNYEKNKADTGVDGERPRFINYQTLPDRPMYRSKAFTRRFGGGQTQGQQSQQPVDKSLEGPLPERGEPMGEALPGMGLPEAPQARPPMTAVEAQVAAQADAENRRAGRKPQYPDPSEVGQPLPSQVSQMASATPQVTISGTYKDGAIVPEQQGDSDPRADAINANAAKMKSETDAADSQEKAFAEAQKTKIADGLTIITPKGYPMKVKSETTGPHGTTTEKVPNEDPKQLTSLAKSLNSTNAIFMQAAANVIKSGGTLQFVEIPGEGKGKPKYAVKDNNGNAVSVEDADFQLDSKGEITGNRVKLDANGSVIGSHRKAPVTLTVSSEFHEKYNKMVTLMGDTNSSFKIDRPDYTKDQIEFGDERTRNLFKKAKDEVERIEVNAARVKLGLKILKPEDIDTQADSNDVLDSIKKSGSGEAEAKKVAESLKGKETQRKVDSIKKEIDKEQKRQSEFEIELASNSDSMYSGISKKITKQRLEYTKTGIEQLKEMLAELED